MRITETLSIDWKWKHCLNWRAMFPILPRLFYSDYSDYSDLFFYFTWHNLIHLQYFEHLKYLKHFPTLNKSHKNHNYNLKYNTIDFVNSSVVVFLFLFYCFRIFLVRRFWIFVLLVIVQCCLVTTAGSHMLRPVDEGCHHIQSKDGERCFYGRGLGPTACHVPC